MLLRTPATAAEVQWIAAHAVFCPLYRAGAAAQDGISALIVNGGARLVRLHTNDTRAYRGSQVSSPTYSGTTLALLGSRPGISIPALHTGHSGSSRCKFNHLYRHSQLHSATDDQRVLSEPGPYPINRPHMQHH